MSILCCLHNTEDNILWDHFQGAIKGKTEYIWEWGECSRFLLAFSEGRKGFSGFWIGMKNFDGNVVILILILYIILFLE